MANELHAFHASWCGPCDQQEPIIESIEENTDVDVIHHDVDTEEGQAVANTYSVRSIPTTIVIDENGDPVERFVGVTEEDEILEEL